MSVALPQTGAWVDLGRPRKMSAAEFKAALREAGMTDLEFGTRIGAVTSTVGRWNKSGPPPYAVAFLDLILTAQQAGIRFEPGRPKGRPRIIRGDAPAE